MRNIKETIQESLVNEGLFGFGKKSWGDVSNILYKKGYMDKLNRVCKNNEGSLPRFVSSKTNEGYFAGFSSIYKHTSIFIPLCKISKLYKTGSDKVEKEDSKAILKAISENWVKLVKSVGESFKKFDSEEELKKEFKEIEMQSYSCDSGSKYDSDTRHPDSYDGSNGKVHGGGHIRAYFDDDAAYDAGLR